jgi:hypothetical protein
MNKILKIATVLSWINMIFWGFVCLVFLWGVLSSGASAMLIILIFPSAIVLHSYAAFQLQKSIKKPAVPLSSQTSGGIRFIGFIALFVGLMMLIQGIGTLTNPQAALKQWQDITKDLQSQTSTKETVLTPTLFRVHLIGIFGLLIGLSVAINVNFNFRLLRWYHFLRNNSNDREK